jgi:hypothetical protein
MDHTIAILIPVCSRNSNYNNLEEIPLFRIFYPSFLKTKNDEYEYKIFIGIDDNDEFYLKYVEELRKYFEVVILKDCNHKPAKAWNFLFEEAYTKGYEYFFQTGDDIYIKSNNWTKEFISKLQKSNNIGVIGPYEKFIFDWRDEKKIPQVIENAFVHKTHYKIFGYLFYPEIENQFCDDWITQVYGDKAILCLEIEIDNAIRNARYIPKQCVNVKMFIQQGRQKLENYFKFLTHNFVFVSYGDKKFEKSKKRIYEEAENCKLFQKIKIYSEEDLTEKFKSDFSYLLQFIRGGGYWIWKFFVFQDILNSTKENDWIVYADCGCKIYEERKYQLNSLVENIKENNKVINAFQMQFIEKDWTKSDLIQYFDCLNSDDILDSGQFYGGIIIFKNCKQTIEFFEVCYRILLRNQNLIDDSPSKIPNADSFIEHRHDQSFLSIFRKINPNLVHVTDDLTTFGDFFIKAERIRE